MKTREKYLHHIKANWIRDNNPLSDADLDKLLGQMTGYRRCNKGAVADPTRNNPTPLPGSDLVGLLSIIIAQENRQLTALIGLLDLDGEVISTTIDAIDGDPVTSIFEVLEVELSRRGPVARPLTRWLLKNVLSLANIAEMHGWDKARLSEELTVYFTNSGRPDYADAIGLYFGEDDVDETELKLLSSCLLLALDYEVVAERAAIMEYDGGMTRTRATMTAVVDAILEKLPSLGEITARCFFETSEKALEMEESHGWTRNETNQWIRDRLFGTSDDLSSRHPVPKRRAV